VNSAALIAARLLVAVVIRLRAAVKVIKLFFHDIHAPDTTVFAPRQPNNPKTYLMVLAHFVNPDHIFLVMLLPPHLNKVSLLIL